LTLLENELSSETRKRFIIVDTRLLGDEVFERFFLEWMQPVEGHYRSSLVSANGIFEDTKRFLGLCEEMQRRNDALFVFTPYNDAIERLVRLPHDARPADPDAQSRIMKWHSLIVPHARSEG
jgi:hypothetical protein